jgi:hypothetical protein
VRPRAHSIAAQHWSNVWRRARASYVEDALFAAAECNGLVADDGQRQSWATIRSRLSKGLLEPKGLER